MLLYLAFGYILKEIHEDCGKVSESYALNMQRGACARTCQVGERYAKRLTFTLTPGQLYSLSIVMIRVNS